MTPDQFQSDRLTATAVRNVVGILRLLAKPLYESSMGYDNLPCWDSSRTFDRWLSLYHAAVCFEKNCTLLQTDAEKERLADALGYAHSFYHAHNAAICDVKASITLCTCEVARLERELFEALEGANNVI